MSEITNASKNDVTLEEFYSNEVKSALQSLALTFDLVVSDDFEPSRAIFADALSQTGHQPERIIEEDDEEEADDDYTAADDALIDDEEEDDDEEAVFETIIPDVDDQPPANLVETSREVKVTELENWVVYDEVAEKMEDRAKQERAIVASTPNQVIEVAEKALQDSVLTISAEEAWQLIYSLIGYRTDYVQDTLLPRWQQNPMAFEKDRRFLYSLFLDTLRNAAGVQHIAGHYTFRDRRITIDGLWTHYFSDLAQNVAPQLAVAKLHNNANDPWYKKLWQSIQQELGNLSPIWLLALAIALVLDALTTYISLDQTPMEGGLVLIFTVLITALFQIADQLVISYRQREFDAEAMSAKYHAQFERLTQEIGKLPVTSESFVQLSMSKSKAHADWKAAEDNRKMARRGRFWSARIADINVAVTAYGFSFLFLNNREPMVAVVEQFEAIFIRNDLKSVDPWTFLMVALAITVSFVINTAQRTEILGWSMRRLKREA